MVMLARKTALEKVASFLLDIHGRSVGKFLYVPMTRTDIADYLVLTIETVCRALAEFRRQGLIAVSHAGIALRDTSALLDFVGAS